MRIKVDIDTLNRKDQFLYFNSFSNPDVSVVSTINIDSIVRYAKDNNISFYALMSYFALKTINEIEDFKYCLDGDDIYIYDKINAAFTVLDQNNIVNFTGAVEYDDIDAFLQSFMKAKLEAETGRKFSSNKDANVVYISCLPTIRIKSLTEPSNVNKKNSIPSIIWGKFFLENDEYHIDVYIRVHHGLLDGYHISEFFLNLEANAREFGNKQKQESTPMMRTRTRLTDINETER